MKKYSNEVHAFIRENVVGRTTKELATLVNEKFGTDFTESKMRSYKKNHKLKSGTPGGFPKGISFIFTNEIQEFINQNFKNIGNQELADMINKKFNTNYTRQQIKSYKKNRKIDSGLTGQFEKGHEPANKGQKMSPEQYLKCKDTMFKKGEMPLNTVPLGTERLSKDGYILIKVEHEKYKTATCSGIISSTDKTKWIGKHLKVWIDNFGDIPPKHNIVFLNQNKNDFRLENLACISAKEHLSMCRNSRYSEFEDVTKVNITLTKLTDKIRSRKKQ